MSAPPSSQARIPVSAVRNPEKGADVILQQRGNLKLVGSSPRSHDPELRQRLWAVSEELTGVTFPL
ncbi:hypothetical protein [Candidatus Mycolicibacterium alkanivorans]|uniref:Uncharacterized protein n=1 Tax=Candidatus Mycolicibacterium alkanivorans TaxID=2954114 RepID=A0ABS9YQX9_9MYCO|nr:hypothetical protein [Candidatus Mycolicibacterium alkanivorans]MCI4673656.1 hypothetical protein [Candidatus Mycolicibacterium alkanivorans]